MKITSGVVLLFLALFATLCHCEEKATDSNQKGLEVEDTEPAESQDVLYRSQPLPDGTTYTDEDRPRRRYRGNGKRRRRQRKRIRSTTPSLIEEHTSHPIELFTEQDDRSAERGEVVYERRRQGKRRRRPLRRPQPFETYRHELPDKEENPTARSSPRRRRKGQRRKRIRVKPIIEDGNYTEENKTNVEQTTLQTEEEITINTYPPVMTQGEQKNVEDNYETMATIMPGSVFTPSEISEINYNLEPVSKHLFDDGEFTLSEQTPNPKQNINEFLYTKIPVKFNIEENNPVLITTLKNIQSSTIDATTPKFTDPGTVEPFKDEILKIKPTLDVGNKIEAIIKSRKSLFSISRRLPPTSAVIRRRLRPRLQKNSTDIETNSKINSPTHLNTDKKVCKDGSCFKELQPAIKNDVPMVPSNLLPAGFMALPEIISPKQLLNKLQLEITSELISSQTPKTEQLSITISNNTTIQTTIATPTTEITPMDSTTAKSSTISLTATTETSTIFSSTKESATHKEITTTNTENLTEETTKVESIKFDADLPNLNDSILDLLTTENGKSRLSRILKLRNMTLQELLDHRERGSSQRHLSDIFTNNKEKIQNETDHLNIDKIGIQFSNDSDHNHNNSDVINLISDDLDGSINMNSHEKFDESFKLLNKENYKTESDRSMSHIEQHNGKSKSLKSIFEDNTKSIKVEGTVIPVSILEPTHVSMIQFPDDNILGAFPKFLTDTLSNRDVHRPIFEELNGHHETKNKPTIILTDESKREPRIFDSMPKFNTKLKPDDQNNLKFNPGEYNLRLNPDYRMLINKASEPNFPRIGDELFFHTSSPTSTIGDIVDDIVLLQENDSHQRNHILGGHISAESEETIDDDYTDYRKLPTGVKSAIFASVAIFGLAILGFLSVLVSCRIRQRKARLRKRNDILCAHLHDDLRSSQNSLTPVLKKGQGSCSGHQFSQGIHSNTSSNRHYYLWRTLRKTFQYE